MIEHTRIGSPNIGLEALIQDSDLAPVEVQCLDIGVTDTCTKVALLKGGSDSTHGWLRGETGHAVDGDIDDISSCGGGGEHGSGRDTSGVVRVNVDGEVGILLANGTDQTKDDDVSLFDDGRVCG